MNSLILTVLSQIMKEVEELDSIRAKQGRAVFTTLCIINKWEADTGRPDSTLWNLFQKSGLRTKINYDEFTNFMYEEIV